MSINTDFNVTWRVTAGAGANGVTAESNLRAVHGNGYSDGTAAGSAWVILPFGTDQILFEFSSVGVILTHSNAGLRKVYTREANIGVTTEALSYVFDNSNLITSQGLPTGVADNSVAQIGYDLKIDCIDDTLSFKCDGTALSSSSPFLSGTISDIVLTDLITSSPTYQVYNGTPSDVQTWPVAVASFSTNWVPPASAFWTDFVLSAETY